MFGLGKLGGYALGYASDIELLFVYSDAGSTDGAVSIRNAEFFDCCFRLATNLIEAKQEGIFDINLRLRPHGSGGPLAVSVDSFTQYYGPRGEAHLELRPVVTRGEGPQPCVVHAGSHPRAGDQPLLARRGAAGHRNISPSG